MDEAKRIAVGSGDLYVKSGVPADIDTSDVDAIITTYVKEDNRFGDTKNGATLTYTPSTHEAKCDFGRVTKTIITSEEVKLECGSITVGPDILKKLVETARVSKSTAGRHVIKIGGIKNAVNTSYIIIFHHPDPVDGDIYIVIIGKNEGELSFPFQPEQETILNPTFKAQAMDRDGTLVIIAMEDEEYIAAQVSGEDEDEGDQQE